MSRSSVSSSIVALLTVVAAAAAAPAGAIAPPQVVAAVARDLFEHPAIVVPVTTTETPSRIERPVPLRAPSVRPLPPRIPAEHLLDLPPPTC